MFRQSTTTYWGQALVDALLNALSVVPGAALLTAPEAHLVFQATTPLDQDYDPANLATDECSFDGYAAAALPALSALGNYPPISRGKHAEVDFVAGAAIAEPGQTAIGYVVTNGAGTALYLAETFVAPVPFGSPGDFLSLDVIFTEPMLRQGQ